MSSRPFLAVAFDLDDTLLRDDLTISSRTMKTLRILAASGVHIIPASGRAQLSMKSFVDQIGCSSMYIACNGAEIWDGHTHALLKAERFSVSLGKEIAAFGREHACYSQTYDGDTFYYNVESEWSRRYAAASMLHGVQVGDLESFIQEPRNKILMMDDEAKIASMLTEAQASFAGRASVTCSKPWFLEFNPINATKGIALSFVTDTLGLTLSDIIAFGDGLNDLSMLKAAGRGVLMANGRDSLRSECDDFCPSNQEDGVAVYLENVFHSLMTEASN